MKRLSAPSRIPYYFNRATLDERTRLEKTLRHFGLSAHEQLVGETLLRLDKVLEGSNQCVLPVDEPSKALFDMYRYYYYLSVQ